MKTTNDVAEGPQKHEKEVKITINGKQYEVHEGLTRVEHLKKLASIPHEDILGKEVDGKFHPLDQDGEVHIHGGEAFRSHKGLVKITINSKPYETHPGENTVTHLRNLGHVPADEILSEFQDGRFIDLAENASVNIQGGEIFASHRPTGGSS